jgi:alkylation response protein AidB-like acyl-CoA dehydrogenase
MRQELAELAPVRERVREYVAKHVPDSLIGSGQYEDLLKVDRLLSGAGYLCHMWPVEYGGNGSSPLEALVVQQELSRCGIALSESPSRLGVRNFAPALIRLGSEEQKRSHLPAIRAVRTIWCQGFSEPDAGSDLASLRTEARITGGTVTISGRKIWTTNAQHADMCAVLARISREPRHRNLVYVMVPMHQPGITVRPLEQIDGRSRFNEVTFDDATAPEANIVGEIGAGWQAAMTTLAAERSLGIISTHATCERYLAEIAHMLSRGKAQHFAGRLGDCVARVAGIETLAYNIAYLLQSGKDIGSLSSAAKNWHSSTLQAVVDLGADVAYATDDLAQDRWFARRVTVIKDSIVGGTAQIQLNIIANRQLGLPRV